MEELFVSGNTKQEKYANLLPQIESILSDETDMIANMANVVSVLHETFHFWWTGFYRVNGQMLILGPFQGPLACTRIPKGKGVCGTAWQEEQTIIVPDVTTFPGHIACSSASKSEIVVPLKQNGKVIGVLDIDSKALDAFDTTDREYLEKITTQLATNSPFLFI